MGMELKNEKRGRISEYAALHQEEGVNLPTEPPAVGHFLEKRVLFGPGKAANAGGVAVSGLEMSQNSMRLEWTREEVDNKLQTIMRDIHDACVKYGSNNNDD